MLVNIQIPDEIYQKYAERKPERPQVAIADALKEFVGLKPGEPRVVVEGELLRKLNTILGYPVSNPTVLVEQVGKLLRVSVGDLSIELSADELKRLAAISGFYRKPGEDIAPQHKEFVTNLLKRAITGVING